MLIDMSVWLDDVRIYSSQFCLLVLCCYHFIVTLCLFMLFVSSFYSYIVFVYVCILLLFLLKFILILCLLSFSTAFLTESS